MTDIGSLLRGLSAAVIPGLLAITLHEVAHGWAAKWRGDRTAEMLGRLSLNPLKHVDPIGTVVMPIALYLTVGFIFGSAKPVPINPRNLRDPKRDMVFVAAAGPASNILMGWLWAIFLAVLFSVQGPMREAGAATVFEFLRLMAEIGIFFNCLLAVFNLIPIPPLDGGRVLRGLVPETIGRRLDAIDDRVGIIIVLLLLLLGLFTVIQPIVRWLSFVLLAAAGVGG